MGSVRAPDSAGPSLPSLLGAASKSPGSRGERRRRLSNWGRGAVKRLRHLGLDITGCDVDDGGLLFVPDGRLALTLDASAVEVALVLPPSDLEALRVILDRGGPSLALTAALSALPEQFALGASSEPTTRIPAPRASADHLRALLDQTEREGGAVWLGWTVPRDVAAEHAATLDAQLQDALVALGQVLRIFARAAGTDAGRGKRSRRHAGDMGESSHDRGKPRGRTRARERDREPEVDREVEPESAADPVAPTPRVLRPAEAKPRLRASLVRGVARPGGGIEKGVKVRVLEGPFAGKEGLVQELDGNGGARVMLGLLAVRIEVNDLVSSAEGRGRPRLLSSHRRPMPVRS